MKIRYLTLLLTVCLSPVMLADQTTEEMDAAVKAYEKGAYGEASSSLQQAIVYVNQKKSETLKPFFPDTIGNLKGEKSKVDNALYNAAGTMLHRQYTNGNARCRVQLALDSPLMAQFGSYINNPQMASAMGLQTRRVNGTKVMFKEKDKSVIMIYNNRFFIQISNTRNLNEQQVLEVLKGLNFEVLKSFK